MQKFLTNEQLKLSDLVTQLNETLLKFNNRDFDAYQTAVSLLNKVIAEFEKMGNTVKQSEVQVILSEMLTAKAGINPITFQKQSSGRLELLNTITFKGLQHLQNLLSQWYQTNEEKLSQASELVSQIITAALQSGMITPADLRKYRSPDDAEKYCARFTKNENIALGEKRVLMMVSKYDCLLLFDELISRLK